MTDRERMEALLAGKTLVSGYGIHLRLSADGILESRFIHGKDGEWSDPDWTPRPNIFGEVSSGTFQNGEPIPERMKERGRYNRVLGD